MNPKVVSDESYEIAKMLKTISVPESTTIHPSQFIEYHAFVIETLRRPEEFLEKHYSSVSRLLPSKFLAEFGATVPNVLLRKAATDSSTEYINSLEKNLLKISNRDYSSYNIEGFRTAVQRENSWDCEASRAASSGAMIEDVIVYELGFTASLLYKLFLLSCD